MAELVEIASSELSAAINSFGSELTHLRDGDGLELMTDADPAFWTGHAPILFPIVGAAYGDIIRVDGVDYPIGKHGFARHSMFAVTERHDDRVIFTLEDSEETRRAYPFAFRLQIAFRIVDATLNLEVEVSNPDAERALPASFGFHPAFAWPLPYGRDRADHRITFADEEPEPLRMIAADGMIGEQTRPSPLDGRTLHLADALFEKDALVWADVRSDRVRYGADDGPALDIAFPDTPKLGVWTKPGARFVCVEPWHGIADPEGYTGEFRDKPGVFEVAPGATKRIAMSITLTA